MLKTKLRTRLIPVLATLLFAGAACSIQIGDPDPARGPSAKPADPSNPGTKLPNGTNLPDKQQAELDKLLGDINDSADMTPQEFADLYKVPFTQSPSYDPKTATGLSIIQASSHSLTSDELKVLGQNGFVIAKDKNFPTFAYGYQTIYSQDLPLFVSADSILYAVHRSYDDILKAVEGASLMGELGSMLGDMRSALAGGGATALGAQARADADVFLSVAESLLKGVTVSPNAGGDASLISELVAGAQSATGMKQVVLFGVKRDVDFSQFKPRGHYTDSPELSRYFQSMMWLGRIDFRMLETQPDGSQVFHRRQLEGALALRELMNQQTESTWGLIDTTIQAFVGESDYMTLPELKSLLADLGVADVADLTKIPDAEVAKAIVTGGYGTQRISSHIMINGIGKATLPLSSSFALFGQRYVVDSHVFSNVVYDRVQKGQVYRMMPDPLDAAFAAIGNNQAGALLSPQITEYKYAPDLHAMRLLVDAHPDEFWGANLYNLWLTSLRKLSPSSELKDPQAAGLPEIAATEAWGRRILNTQLASWAELRHDTILYAKQSYTGGASCEFPDAYVDPYPGFYKGIRELAVKGSEVVDKLDLSAQPWLTEKIPAYFKRLESIASKLEGMAEHQRSGAPFTVEQMAFINQAVAVQLGCGDPVGSEGWYSELFFDNHSSVAYDPTIADVHTQPTDEAGNMVGRVLHVGTGMPRFMVVTINTCSGPRAYAGLASSYFEQITDNFERLDDEGWADELTMNPPADVPWMNGLVVP